MNDTSRACVDEHSEGRTLDFLWMELTNQCNLQCVHCYSESTPHSTQKDLLTEHDYLNLIADASALGCRQLQFIGGEPTLNKSLPHLIAYAEEVGFEFIEVFSNLVSVSEDLFNVFLKHKVAVATSIYAHTPELHDSITLMTGSHKKTISNVKRLLNAGLRVRVSVIAMEQNGQAIDATFEFLHNLGVSTIGLDHVRSFGRAQAEAACSMDNLCGNCANNILAIGPDGTVSPCIMSKQWSAGSVRDTPLKQIAESRVLAETRRRIADATSSRLSGPNPCQPDASCMPNCNPSYNCTPCSPNASQPCEPNRWCNPSKR